MSEIAPLSRRTNIFLGDRQTTLFNRLVAKFIDALIVGALYFIGRAIWPPLGVFGAFFFAAFQDSFGVGQSIGKRIIGLKVIDDRTGASCNFAASFLRNMPFSAIVLFVPFTVLWIPLLCVALPIIGFEIYLLITLETGIRLGDVLTDSLVVEYLSDDQISF